MKKLLLSIVGVVYSLVGVAALTPISNHHVTKPVTRTISTEAKSFQKSMWRAPMLGAPIIKSDELDSASDVIIGESWGWLDTPDGVNMLYTMTPVMEKINDWVYGYKGAEITVYDDNYDKINTIVVTAPTFEDGQYVNNLSVFPYLTSKFFDSNKNTYELIVTFNVVVQPGVLNYYNKAYSLSTGEDLGMDIDGLIVDYICHKPDSFSQFEFLTTTNYAVKEIDGADTVMQQFNIIKSKGLGDAPAVDKTLEAVYDNLIYIDAGPVFNTWIIDNNLYAALTYYEKPYMTPESNSNMNADPIPSEDNNFVIELYSRPAKNSGSWGNEPIVTKIPVMQREGYLYSFYSLGAFSDNDLCKGDFTEDGALNYIITNYCYEIESDEYFYFFDAYNQSGTQVKMMAEKVSNWRKLFPVNGQCDQYAFQYIVDSTAEIHMVDYPSCETVAVFPEAIDGRTLSVSFDRYPSEGGYQYVFNLSQGELADNGDVYHVIGWYNSDATVNRYVKINLGPDDEYSEAQIDGAYLNPYLFDANDAHEYIILAKMTREGDEEAKDEVLFIAGDDGTILRQYKGDDQKGAFSWGAVCNLSSNPSMFTAYMDENYISTIEHESLPFNDVPLEGEGTAESPYLIKNVPNMLAIADNPEACYKLANDIDMIKLASGWVAIPSFSGSFDGDGNVISNMYISPIGDYAAMFGELSTGAEIKNVKFKNATVECASNNFYASLLGNMTSAVVEDIYVDKLTVNADDGFSGVIGGLSAHLNGMIVEEEPQPAIVRNCSIDKLHINAPSASYVGGVAGESASVVEISACAVYGGIYAEHTVGGIIGKLGGITTLSDCNVKAQLLAKHTIGGVAGLLANNIQLGSRSLINRCVVTGSIRATENSKWYSASVGGIAGMVESDWTDSPNPVISNCFVNLEKISLPEDPSAAHRIAGYTIAEEAEESEEAVVKTELGLLNNYVVSSLGVVDNTIDATSSSVEGASIESDVVNADFFATTLGFVYGDNVEAPWKNGYSYWPLLYFEDAETADITKIELNKTSVVNYDGTTVECADAVSVALYGVNGALVAIGDNAVDVTSLSAGIYMVVVRDASGNYETTKIIVK